MSNNATSKISISNAAHIDAYYTYNKIVGDDDNGKLFSEKEYQDYCKNIASKRSENRLYVSWVNSTGFECRAIGPETRCFCGHRYRQHKTDIPDANSSTNKTLTPNCREKSCPCKTFTFVPTSGSRSGPFVKCKCKHDHDLHDIKSHKCAKFNCNCSKYQPTWTCTCGEPAYKHKTIVENRLQRAEKGKRTEFGEVNGERHSRFGEDVNGGLNRGVPVSSMYQALGGLTGHTSLLDGMARLEFDGANNLYLETRRKLMLEESNKRSSKSNSKNSYSKNSYSKNSSSKK